MGFIKSYGEEKKKLNYIIIDTVYINYWQLLNKNGGLLHKIKLQMFEKITAVYYILIFMLFWSDHSQYPNFTHLAPEAHFGYRYLTGHF